MDPVGSALPTVILSPPQLSFKASLCFRKLGITAKTKLYTAVVNDHIMARDVCHHRGSYHRNLPSDVLYHLKSTYEVLGLVYAKLKTNKNAVLH